MNEELLMRAVTGRASDAELAAVRAWEAAAPENARHLEELRRILAGISAWYRATPVRPPPPVETLVRRAELRQAQSGVAADRAHARRVLHWLPGVMSRIRSLLGAR